MTGAGPGRMPMKNPRIPPRIMGQKLSFQSCRLGRRFLTFVAMTSLLISCSTLAMTSATPKRPMIAGISPTPSLSSRRPKVSRWVAEIESIPMVPMSSPKTAIISAFKMDPEAR